jgi:hypothetical protein
MIYVSRIFLALLVYTGITVVYANDKTPENANKPLTLQEALTPYAGPVNKGVDTNTLRGKIMCGYQGWFAAEGDGYGRGFVHWGGVTGNPPRASVDLWPDLSEYNQDEKYPTNFRHQDGAAAYVFSSADRRTVLRHFKWMNDYGIDGVFVQRFTSVTGDEKRYRISNTVLNRCREGANTYGRAFAVMYDTSLDRKSVDAIKTDWTRLTKEMQILSTPAYIKHRGAPIVVLWGYGFREFDPVATEELLQFFKQSENGGCTIMVGVPNDWREWKDAKIQLIEKYVSVIQPWNVGRYSNPETAKAHFEKLIPDDIEWCKKRDKDYYAVIFPGFSWSNLKNGQNLLNAIPRLGGKFFWSQVELVKKYGMDMAYVAMFDEVDEGTAIFKCTNNPPAGRFCTYEGYPSDHYLKLAGLAGQLLRGENISFPDTKPDPAQMSYKPVSLLDYYDGSQKLPEQSTKKLKSLFNDIPIGLIGCEQTCSTWIYALNKDTFKISQKDWKTIEETVPDSRKCPIMIFGSGNETFGIGEGIKVDTVVSNLKDYVKNGGTLLVMSGGRYPMYYPDDGVNCKNIGLNLGFIKDKASMKVVFSPDLPGGFEEWTPTKGIASRLPSRGLYPNNVRYKSLVSVISAEGNELGDLIAVIGPGGNLDNGRIIYLASSMQEHPKKELLLASLLEYVGTMIKQE